MKDHSKAAHASDADLEDLVKFRGVEMKKPLAEAKCSDKRYEQVGSYHPQRYPAVSFHRLVIIPVQ